MWNWKCLARQGASFQPRKTPPLLKARGTKPKLTHVLHLLRKKFKQQLLNLTRKNFTNALQNCQEALASLKWEPPRKLNKRQNSTSWKTLCMLPELLLKKEL